ncbi:flagellin [Pseudomonas helleri]|uniref:Flagellin n=2 Tax=Pseudomonas TaxID=286 RepID=A0A6A7YKA2_9PSED|nr:flagellin [Pseudomonas helleri]MQT32995.1 flagellin [Pseudomonas helleri]MQT48528.1 flagellin [Pseudomonas helleri]MQT90546.1 flagellin [Pseudomonas helleri]
MALSVNTNVTSLTVQKNLNKAGDALSTSMTRLSSGLKINSAKDDAAGLQMANRLTSQTKGMTVAINNANNGSSIAQTAEGAMQESTNILQRLRELALQSANGDKSDADRASLQQEFTAKTGELTRIAQTTTFGGRNILDGSFQNVGFQVGADANQTITFGMGDISATALKGSSSEATVAGAATKLSASVTGNPVTLPGGIPAGPSTTSPYTATATYAAPTGAETFKINGADVTIGANADIDAAIGAINGVAAAGVVASKDGAGTGLILTSTTGAIAITGTTTTGLQSATAGGGTVTPGTAAVPGKLDSDTSININGQEVAFKKDDDMAAVAKAINDANTASKTGVSASLNSDGRLQLTSSDGKAIKLANGDAATGGSGALAKVGLSTGSTDAKLGAATSLILNGTEVKFNSGSTLADVVSSINSASTGVTASLDKDGGLKLFSTKDITIADGSAGTGLSTLGLTDAAKSTTAVKTESSVADLSILKADDAQKTIQALGDAIAQIDTQRAALGAVQNRFDSTVANLQSISENSTAALGRVQDTDFASEAAQLTKQQTLQQASTAILSQANQLPSAVMKLLQ